jgi:hypothetical protein
MRRRFYLTLDEPEARALIGLAEREYRHPRDRAAKLLVESLKRRGALAAAADRPAEKPAAVAASA